MMDENKNPLDEAAEARPEEIEKETPPEEGNQAAKRELEEAARRLHSAVKELFTRIGKYAASQEVTEKADQIRENASAIADKAKDSLITGAAMAADGADRLRRKAGELLDAEKFQEKLKEIQDNADCVNPALREKLRELLGMKGAEQPTPEQPAPEQPAPEQPEPEMPEPEQPKEPEPKDPEELEYENEDAPIRFIKEQLAFLDEEMAERKAILMKALAERRAVLKKRDQDFDDFVATLRSVIAEQEAESAKQAAQTEETACAAEAAEAEKADCADSVTVEADQPAEKAVDEATEKAAEIAEQIACATKKAAEIVKEVACAAKKAAEATSADKPAEASNEAVCEECVSAETVSAETDKPAEAADETVPEEDDKPAEQPADPVKAVLEQARPIAGEIVRGAKAILGGAGNILGGIGKDIQDAAAAFRESVREDEEREAKEGVADEAADEVADEAAEDTPAPEAPSAETSCEASAEKTPASEAESKEQK